jgi:Cu/Ag efflux protein CusF
MQKFMGAVIAFILVLSLPGLASAVDEKPTVKKAKARTKQISGEVAEIDLKAQTVTVRGKNGTVSAGLTDKTKIVMNKEVRTLGDLQSGDRVTMKYKESDGKQTAKSIEIKVTSKKSKLPTS